MTRSNTVILQVTFSKRELFRAATESPVRHQETKLASECYLCWPLNLKKFINWLQLLENYPSRNGTKGLFPHQWSLEVYSTQPWMLKSLNSPSSPLSTNVQRENTFLKVLSRPFKLYFYNASSSATGTNCWWKFLRSIRKHWREGHFLSPKVMKLSRMLQFRQKKAAQLPTKRSTRVRKQHGQQKWKLGGEEGSSWSRVLLLNGFPGPLLRNPGHHQTASLL